MYALSAIRYVLVRWKLEAQLCHATRTPSSRRTAPLGEAGMSSAAWLALACLSSASGSAEGGGRKLPLSVDAKVSVKPCVKVRKNLRFLSTKLSVHWEHDVADKVTTYHTSWKDTVVGGDLSLQNLTLLVWKKTWLLPGLTDAATKVQVRSFWNLKTGQADARVSLGLRRRFSPQGLSLVHSVPVDAHGRCTLDRGCTVTVPEELQVTARHLVESSHSAVLPAPRFCVDFDRLDLCLDF